MALFRAQVVFPYFTNLPKDVITNTLYVFSTVGADTKESVGTAFQPLLDNFYTSIYSVGGANYVQYPNAVINWYAMDDAPPRQPFTINLGMTGFAGAATPIPTEVACVLSFQAVPQSGIPQARRRGRIYIGGLNSAWFNASGASAFPTLTSTALTTVGNAASALANQTAQPTLSWRIYSQVSGISNPVDNGWVDQSPDTQRRRSVDAVSRTLWT